MTYPRLQDAFSEMAANSQLGLGSHQHPFVAVGVPGTILAEVPFDPAQHNMSDINHLSLFGEAMDTHFVTEVLPDRPLEVQVVTDYGNLDDHDAITSHKRNGAKVLTDVILGSLPSITDRVSSFAVGSGRDNRHRKDETRLVTVEASDKERARSVARLCSEGITLVISDFRHLPLERFLQGDAARNTLAIKLNHHLERHITRRVPGILSLGGGFELDTSDEKQVALVNGRLDKRHAEVMARLRKTGMAVTNVTLEPVTSGIIHPPYVDKRLSEGVKALVANQ